MVVLGSHRNSRCYKRHDLTPSRYRDARGVVHIARAARVQVEAGAVGSEQHGCVGGDDEGEHGVPGRGWPQFESRGRREFSGRGGGRRTAARIACNRRSQGVRALHLDVFASRRSVLPH